MAGIKDAEAGKRGAIIGTGTSVESVPLSTFDEYDFTIGLNEVVKFYHPKYLCLADERAIAKIVEHLPDKLIVVSTADVAMHIQNFPPFTPSGKAADEAFAKFDCYQVTRATRINERQFCITGGTLSVALSLASWLGAAECDLYGCDFYRTMDQQYAYAASPAAFSKLIEIGDGRYTTPAMMVMVNGIETQAHKYTERGTKFRNMNPLSELRCFEGGSTYDW